MNNNRQVRIVSRRYYSEPDGGGDEIVLSLEQPFQDEPGSFQCVYRFGGAVQREQRAVGVDGIHALLVALSMAGSDLEILTKERYSGKLYWEAGTAESSLPTVRDHWPFKPARTE